MSVGGGAGARLLRILTLILKPPGVRRAPNSGDLVGDFHGWFDGGAFRDDTGSRSYSFVDGTSASMHTCVPYLRITIRFPDGSIVAVQEATDREPAQRSGTPGPTRCAGCGEPIQAATTFVRVGPPISSRRHAACRAAAPLAAF